MKLEEFLRTKGTVRLTAADARAEARRMQLQEQEMRVYNRHANVLEAIKVRHLPSYLMVMVMTILIINIKEHCMTGPFV